MPAAPPRTTSRLVRPFERSSSSDMSPSLWELAFRGDAAELLALGPYDDLTHGDVRRLAERVDHRLGDVLGGERLDRVEQRAQVRVAPGERGVDQARLDQRDPDPGRLELEPDRVRDSDLGPFRGDVHRLADVRVPARDRGHDQDV